MRAASFDSPPENGFDQRFQPGDKTVNSNDLRVQLCAERTITMLMMQTIISMVADVAASIDDDSIVDDLVQDMIKRIEAISVPADVELLDGTGLQPRTVTAAFKRRAHTLSNAIGLGAQLAIQARASRTRN